jgi:hypothetical protein
MSFLQPWLLASLPLALIPIIIHLINQRRFQTRRWGAMMFLLAANRMNKGYARLRQWLILMMRVLAVAALLLAVARPLASGLLGMAGGGRPDVTFILLDRSPSMQQTEGGAGRSKLEAARGQLASALGTIGSGRWVLVESGHLEPREFEQLEGLLDSALTGPLDATADIPAMLLSVLEYIEANQPGQVDIWIASDSRTSSWKSDDARWDLIRQAFSGLPQNARFMYLAYPGAAAGNWAIQVEQVRKRSLPDATELELSFSVRQTDLPADIVDASGAAEMVPVRIELEGVRTELQVPMRGGVAELKNHRLRLDGQMEQGWGKVSLAADANMADNQWYFVFDDPAPGRTLLWCESVEQRRPLALAAGIAPDQQQLQPVEVIGQPEQLAEALVGAALLIWQGALPTGQAAERVAAFVERGGQVIFFPPAGEVSEGEFLGVGWGDWERFASPRQIDNWRSESGLLANTQAGGALPVAELELAAARKLQGPLTPLATLQGLGPWLGRLETSGGGVTFCGSLVDPASSNLAIQGVVLYVMLQRAIDAGRAALGGTAQLVAGQASAEQVASWERLELGGEALSSDYHLQAGVYRNERGLTAINRDPRQDLASVLAGERLDANFEGLRWSRMSDSAASLAGIVQEIWRGFLIFCLLSLLAEAMLCLPRPSAAGPSAATASGAGSGSRRDSLGGAA